MESKESANSQSKNSPSVKMSPSQVLKNAEAYWEKQALISECLKEAFILLSGIQLATRRENLLLSSATFPDDQIASVTINDDQSLNINSELQEKSLRLWLAGFRATSDMKTAQRLFQRALQLSIAATKDMQDVHDDKVGRSEDSKSL